MWDFKIKVFRFCFAFSTPALFGPYPYVGNTACDPLLHLGVILQLLLYSSLELWHLAMKVASMVVAGFARMHHISMLTESTTDLFFQQPNSTESSRDPKISDFLGRGTILECLKHWDSSSRSWSFENMSKDVPQRFLDSRTTLSLWNTWGRKWKWM